MRRPDLSFITREFLLGYIAAVVTIELVFLAILISKMWTHTR